MISHSWLSDVWMLQYNGCMWKGGRLKLEKAKEDYQSRLRREWMEAAQHETKLPNQSVDADESVCEMPKPKKEDIEKMQLKLFFPKLRKVNLVKYWIFFFFFFLARILRFLMIHSYYFSYESNNILLLYDLCLPLVLADFCLVHLGIILVSIYSLVAKSDTSQRNWQTQVQLSAHWSSTPPHPLLWLWGAFCTSRTTQKKSFWASYASKKK